MTPHSLPTDGSDGAPTARDAPKSLCVKAALPRRPGRHVGGRPLPWVRKGRIEKTADEAGRIIWKSCGPSATLTPAVNHVHHSAAFGAARFPWETIVLPAHYDVERSFTEDFPQRSRSFVGTPSTCRHKSRIVLILPCGRDLSNPRLYVPRRTNPCEPGRPKRALGRKVFRVDIGHDDPRVTRPRYLPHGAFNDNDTYSGVGQSVRPRYVANQRDTVGICFFVLNVGSDTLGVASDRSEHRWLQR